MNVFTLFLDGSESGTLTLITIPATGEVMTFSHLDGSWRVGSIDLTLNVIYFERV
jgi:hypothetical protein